VGDEVDLVAVVPRIVAGRRVRPTGEEEIGEARALHAEERPRTIGPVVLECETVAASDPHARERAGAEVEAGCPHDDVEWPYPFRGLDPVCVHAHDWRLLEIDE